MKPDKTDDKSVPGRPLWSADALAKSTLADFLAANSSQDNRRMLTEYFRVTHYYARTLMLCREGFESKNERLILAVLANLISLDWVLSKMYQTDPDVIPLALPLTEAFHDRFTRGLIRNILHDAARGLRCEEIITRLNEGELVGDITSGDALARLNELVQNGTVDKKGELYRLVPGKQMDISVGNAVVRTLVGEKIAAALLKHGFDKPESILSRRTEFRKVFVRVSGLSEKIAVLLGEVMLAFVDEAMAMTYRWRIRDLIHSGIPRPYQLEAYAVFRGFGYKNVVIEAPTGSGKTLIGMLCIQDWLRSLTPGESVLILVPTVNYQQQWVKELCFSKFGLDMPPELVYAGTPEGLTRYCRRTGQVPAVTILTYVGSTGFLADATADISRLVGSYNVKYVILDEVHKVVDDLDSESARVVSALCLSCSNKSIHGLIGFTGTAEEYRERFEQLGLQLVHSIPMTDLIASGFVAPFCEFGVPFAYSEREYGVLHLLNEYKLIVKEYLQFLGPERLRAEFAKIPIDRRVQIARDLFGMYPDRSNRDQLIRTRLQTWESGGEISLSELVLLLIVQIATRRSDSEMITKAQRAQFEDLLARADFIRRQLQGLVILVRFEALLDTTAFGKTLDHAALDAITESQSPGPRAGVMNLIATTIGGLYDGLSDWYRHTGEGRVAAVKAIIEAENKTRKISGTIVFDQGRRLRRQESGVIMPGFAGVGGLFAQIVGTRGITPIAALSDEIYLPMLPKTDLPKLISNYIQTGVVGDEIAETIVDLVLANLEIGVDFSSHIRGTFRGYFDLFIEHAIDEKKTSLALFDRMVLSPMRNEFGHRRQGVSRDLVRRVKDRLRIQNPHLRSLLTTGFDYTAIIRLLNNSEPSQLIQAGGATQQVYIIPMPSGRRKQLMYDLVARLVDDSSVPLNMVIVSNWARTGWNVIRPDLLIDATATRNVVAWQQLRGRAMRAKRTWTNDCYDVLSMLSARLDNQFQLNQSIPEDVRRIHDELIRTIKSKKPVTKTLLKLLAKVLTDDEKCEFDDTHDLDIFTSEEKLEIGIRMMLKYNKVTHIYELIKATGSPSQLTFDRKTGNWRRNEAIAQKHAQEIAVDLITGTLKTGEIHAPMIYHADPRHDSPSDLSAVLHDRIDGIDSQIVRAWMQAPQLDSPY